MGLSKKTREYININSAYGKQTRVVELLDQAVEDWWNLVVPTLNKYYGTKAFKALKTNINASFTYTDRTVAGPQKFKINFSGVYRYNTGKQPIMYLGADVVRVEDGVKGSHDDSWTGAFPSDSSFSYISRVIDYAMKDAAKKGK